MAKSVRHSCWVEVLRSGEKGVVRGWGNSWKPGGLKLRAWGSRVGYHLPGRKYAQRALGNRVGPKGAGGPKGGNEQKVIDKETLGSFYGNGEKNMGAC